MANVQTTRRSFLRQAAGGVAALAAATRLAGAEEPASQPASQPATAPAWRRPLNLAFVGLGNQGRTLLLDNCLKMTDHDLRIQAVCDIWPLRRLAAEKMCKRYKHETRAYEDIHEMLEKEKGLDAVLIATPDWMHAEQSVACLEAGLHVYCETPMACSIESARRMVRTAGQSKRLLQIANPYRSRPRYRTVRRMIRDLGGIGEFVLAGAHYRRIRQPWPEPVKSSQPPDADVVRRYGYGSVERLLQWRRYRKFSAGPLAQQGSLQVDVLNWLLAGKPSRMTVTADVSPPVDWEWPDNIIVVYEWNMAQGGQERTVQGTYQVAHRSGFGACAEYLGGTEGGVQLSCIPSQNYIRRDINTEPAPWETGLARLPIEVGPSPSWPVNRYYDVSVKPEDEFPLHWDHLANFLQAVRSNGAVPLNCPADEAFRTAVCTLRAEDALKYRMPIHFAAGEYAI